MKSVCKQPAPVKGRMTIEQHHATGRELKRILSELHRQAVLVSNTYRASEKAGKDTEAARCRLDSLFAQDYPEAFSKAVYYGSADEREGR